MKASKAIAMVGTAAAGLLVIGLAVPPMAGASASVPKVTGSVALLSPGNPQYASFNAFPATSSTPLKGSVSYTNFGAASSGSGVWGFSPGPVTIDFQPYGTEHVMTVTSVTPLSLNSFQFTGTGTQTGYPGVTWTAVGTVTSTPLLSTVAMTITYTGDYAPYVIPMTGTIAADGSAAGPETGPDPGTWSMPPNSFREVLAYTASVTCASLNLATPPALSTGTFGFTIPPGVLGYAGTNVVVNVTDGGLPGSGGDVWAHGVSAGPGSCSGTTYPQAILSGNIVIHS